MEDLIIDLAPWFAGLVLMAILALSAMLFALDVALTGVVAAITALKDRLSKPVEPPTPKHSEPPKAA